MLILGQISAWLPGHAHIVNKKGNILLNLEQFKDDPHKQHVSL